MGTRNKPNPRDCAQRALPDEPQFTLLARSPEFALVVQTFADIRETRRLCGDAPDDDYDMIVEARQIAAEGAEWRRNNLGVWREGSDKTTSDQPTTHQIMREQLVAARARQYLLHEMEQEIDRLFPNQGLNRNATSELSVCLQNKVYPSHSELDL